MQFLRARAFKVRHIAPSFVLGIAEGKSWRDAVMQDDVVENRALDSLCQKFMAFFAEGTGLEIDVFDGVGKIHYTAIVFAMDQPEAMPEFVDSLFLATLIKKIQVFRQPVELLTETTNGNDCRRIVELSFAENERKGGHEQVYIRYSKQFCVVRVAMRKQSFQQFCRIVLFSFDVMSAFQTYGGIAHLAGKMQIFWEREREELNNRGVHTSDWKNQ